MNKKFVLLAILFNVCLIASNLFETKIFTAGSLTLTGGLLIFPISYIINDCITEVYGFRNARNVIVTAMCMNLFLVFMAQLVIMLPEAPFWDGQQHFEYVFKADLRITIASMAAFLTGSILNALVMDRMRSKGGRFGIRAIVSTVIGETADSLVFFPIAFWAVGLSNMVVMMVTQIILKTLYEIIVLPVTCMVVKKIA